MRSWPQPMAVSKVADESTAAQPARWVMRCEPNMPSAATAMVHMPAPSSQCAPK